QRCIRQAGQRKARLRLFATSSPTGPRGARRADRNQHIGVQLDPLKAIRIESARQRRMMMSKQELDLCIEQQLFASAKVGGNQLNRSLRPRVFRLSNPVGKERL